MSMNLSVGFKYSLLFARLFRTSVYLNIKLFAQWNHQDNKNVALVFLQLYIKTAVCWSHDIFAVLDVTGCGFDYIAFNYTSVLNRKDFLISKTSWMSFINLKKKRFHY